VRQTRHQTKTMVCFITILIKKFIKFIFFIYSEDTEEVDDVKLTASSSPFPKEKANDNSRNSKGKSGSCKYIIIFFRFFF
jgi:hypothetical protein